MTGMELFSKLQNYFPFKFCYAFTHMSKDVQRVVNYIAQMDNWISVEDEMPKRIVPVANCSDTVIIQNGGSVREAYYDHRNKQWKEPETHTIINSEFIKLWQPKPKARKENNA